MRDGQGMWLSDLVVVSIKMGPTRPCLVGELVTGCGMPQSEFESTTVAHSWCWACRPSGSLAYERPHFVIETCAGRAQSTNHRTTIHKQKHNFACNLQKNNDQKPNYRAKVGHKLRRKITNKYNVERMHKNVTTTRKTKAWTTTAINAL